MQYDSTCNGIYQIEKLPKELVKLGMAELAKGRDIISNGQYKEGVSKVYVKVYLVYIGDELPAQSVAVRFWYDERYDKACWKMSDEGWSLLMTSKTVVWFLLQLIKEKVMVNGDNKVDEEKLGQLLNDAITKVEEKVKTRSK